MIDRNSIEYDGWVLEHLKDLSILSDFDCADDDLNDYYHSDVRAHQMQLLTQTYCFHPSGEPYQNSLAFVDFCNDCVKKEEITKNQLKRFSQQKRYPFFPAVKVTRLGVAKETAGNGIGSKLLWTIKYFFLTNNRTGCRFITVDAYDKEEILRFYVDHNDFKYYPSAQCDARNTVPLIYDLKNIQDDVICRNHNKS